MFECLSSVFSLFNPTTTAAAAAVCVALNEQINTKETQHQIISYVCLCCVYVVALGFALGFSFLSRNWFWVMNATKTERSTFLGQALFPTEVKNVHSCRCKVWGRERTKRTKRTNERTNKCATHTHTLTQTYIRNHSTTSV